MRHKVYGKHLGRNRNQRQALFKGLVQSLLLEESIQTTESKAKAVKGLVDKIINQAKSANTRRLVAQFVQNPKAQEKLVKDVSKRFTSRNSGYTSIVKMGRRLGDGAMVVRMSLVEGPKQESSKKEVKPAVKAEAKIEAKSEKAPKKTEVKKEAKKGSK